MATTGFIPGQLLAGNLDRSLSLGVDGDLLYIDVNNVRVGIKNNTPITDFDVTGSIRSSNLNDTSIVYSDLGILTSDNNFTYNASSQQIFVTGGFQVSGTEYVSSGVNAPLGYQIDTGTNQNIVFLPGTGGAVTISGVRYPTSDGTFGQAIVTDGNGVLTFGDVSTSFTIGADSGPDDTFSITGTSVLQFTGGVGLTTTVSDDAITFDANIASTTIAGVSFYDPAIFDVNVVGFVTLLDNSIGTAQLNNGAVTADKLALNSVDSTKIIDGSITNFDLQNSDVTIGDKTIALGGVETELTGLTLLEVDNFRFDGSTMSTTDAIGNMVIQPANHGTIQFNTESALIMPQGPQSARPATPTTGMTRYNYDTNQIEFYNGTEWVISGSGLANLTFQNIAPDGTSSVFALDQEATVTTVLVTLNGLLQEAGIAYNISGTDIIFSDTPEITDHIQIRFLTEVSTIVGLSDSSGTTEIQTTGSSIDFTVANQDVMQLSATKLVDLQNARSLKLPTYSVAGLATVSSPTPGEVVYVSNGDGGVPCLAVYDGTQWSKIILGGPLSAS